MEDLTNVDVKIMKETFGEAIGENVGRARAYKTVSGLMDKLFDTMCMCHMSDDKDELNRVNLSYNEICFIRHCIISHMQECARKELA